MADTPEVLALIRRTMGQQGEADEIRGSLEWSSKGEAGEKYVTLSSRGGTTTITRAILGKVGVPESAKLQKVVDDLARLTEESGD